MRIYDNGIYRDATPEEIEIFERTPAPGTQDEPTAEDKAEAYDILMGVNV